MVIMMSMGNVIAAVRNDGDFDAAVKSGVKKIFMLDSNILTVEFMIKKAHQAGKEIFIHVDFAEGVGKDKYGLMFLKQCGADGIITTKTSLIGAAKKIGLFAVQRFFIVDSHSLKTSLDSARMSKPDMIEIMPCSAAKIIKVFKETLPVPVIAGGLIETKAELDEAINAGARFGSTSARELWD